MSRSSKPLNAAKVSDFTLGAFALVPTSETLDHAIRYLSTWSGSDKFFMIIQYAVKLIVPFLHARARLQHYAGFRKNSVSQSAARWTKLASIIGDSRTLWRLWGLLPILQWMAGIERNRPPTRSLLNIERLQGWSMLAYYPLEHLYYLASHGVLPPTLPHPLSLINPFSSSSCAKRIPLNVNKLALWSCRFWAAYVFLQFAHLWEDRKLLKMSERAMHKAHTKGKAPATTAQEERADLRRRWDAFWTEFTVNAGYFPLTLHWSLENGLFGNEVWVGVFGLIAGLASFRNGWKATALPTAAAGPASSSSEGVELEMGGLTGAGEMDAPAAPIRS